MASAIRRLGLDHQLVRNRGELMVLPAGVTKATGLLEALADLGGGPSRDVAVLGRAPGGAARAVVLDPVTGAVLATAQLAAGYTADDLASLIGSGDLATLGHVEAGDSLVTVRRAATGAEVSSFTVP